MVVYPVIFVITLCGFLGKILKVDKQFKALWQAFWPKKTALLLAYPSPGVPGATFSALLPFAGLLLLFHDQIAYYYQAASIKLGKKLAASSLLVWEALRLSKKKGCKTFDFEGIFDPRFPQKSWLGFTKFKKGFGGREIVYPPSLTKTFFNNFMSRPHKASENHKNHTRCLVGD